MPSGLSQKPEVDTSDESSREALLVEKPTRADQKLVSLIDLPEGRSIMNLPKLDLSQKPPLTASDVHTYVFCYGGLRLGP